MATVTMEMVVMEMWGYPHFMICIPFSLQSECVVGDPPDLQAAGGSAGQGAEECRQRVRAGSMVEPREEPGKEESYKSHQWCDYA